MLILSNSKNDFTATNKINLQDLFKFIAIISMIIDHIGYYFFTETVILRVIGRLAMPIFAFYVGYNNSIKKLNILLLAATFVFLIDYLNHYIVVNILFNLLIVKLLIRYMANNPNQKRDIVIVFLLYFGNFYFFKYVNAFKYIEYGTLVSLFAISGLKFKKNYIASGNCIAIFTTIYLLYIALSSSLFKDASYTMMGLTFFSSIFPIVIFNVRSNHDFKSYNKYVRNIILYSKKNTLNLYIFHIVLLHLLVYMRAKIGH